MECLLEAYGILENDVLGPFTDFLLYSSTVVIGSCLA